MLDATLGVIRRCFQPGLVPRPVCRRSRETIANCGEAFQPASQAASSAAYAKKKEAVGQGHKLTCCAFLRGSNETLVPAKQK